MDSLLADF